MRKVWNWSTCRVHRGGRLRRVYIPKEDGGQRSLASDKILQRAVTDTILVPRDGVPRVQLRFPAGTHNALDAVTVERRKVNWIVDARGFFDNRDHLVAMLERRIGGLIIK